MDENDIFNALINFEFAQNDDDEFVIEGDRMMELYDAIASIVQNEIDGGDYKKGWIDGYSASMRDDQRAVRNGRTI